MIGFVNHGVDGVRLLCEFEPLPVFFAFDLSKADGTPIGLPGGGKIDFGPGGPRYVELGPGELYAFDVDVGRLLTVDLGPGSYLLSATYHNQYGDGFQGVLKSNVVDITLPEH